MSIESKDLIEGNESINVMGWNKYPSHDSNSVWSKQIVYKGILVSNLILKVLSHRKDSVAQKFIEKTSYTFG
jgi:hypothetical protein